MESLQDLGFLKSGAEGMMVDPQRIKDLQGQTFFDSQMKDELPTTSYSGEQRRGTPFKNTRWLTFDVQQIDLLTRSNPQLKNAINYLASLPLINGIDINIPKEDLTSEELFNITTKIRSMYRPLKDALSKSYAYGGSAALMVFSGDTKEKLKTPLIVTSIKKNSFLGLKPLSRWYGVEPAIEMGLIKEIGPSTGFNDAYMIGLPMYYWVHTNGGLGGLSSNLNNENQRQLVHASRLFIFNTETVSVIETEIERYWGASLLELMYNDLVNDKRLWNSTLKSAEKNNMGIMKIKGLGIAGTLNEVTRKKYMARMELIKGASSHNIVPIDDQDSFEFAQAVLSGQADILNINNSRLAGSAGVPVSIMYPGESSDKEDRLYIQSRAKAEDTQERQLRPTYDTLIQVIIKSEVGKKVKNVSFSFNPIETMTLTEKSTVFKNMTDGLATLYDIGLDKSSILNMMDDIRKDPMNIAQNINSKFREYIMDKATKMEFETKNSDQILVAKELNQSKEGLAGVSNPASDIGGDKGGDPTKSLQPLGRNALNPSKGKK